MVHPDNFINFLGIAIIFMALVIVIMGMAELIKWFTRRPNQNDNDLMIGKRKLHTLK